MIMWFWLVLLSGVCGSVFGSLSQKETYKGAVYEHQYIVGKAHEYALKQFTQVALDAKDQGVDILVYPEACIYENAESRDDVLAASTYVPEPNSAIILCNTNSPKYSDDLRNFSCLAKKTEMYLLFNIVERSDCTETSQQSTNDTDSCASDGLNYYNTNVVFDRTGKIVARYRKFNLFAEWNFNSTKNPELVTFTTDFGVTFGTFSCFDILFEDPAITLVRNYNIRHFVYPARWMSEIPFLTALQVQYGWSKSNNVTLLAANTNFPYLGSSGSGIYQGSTSNYYVTGHDVSTLIINNISKENSHLDSTPFIKQYFSNGSFQVTNNIKIDPKDLDTYVLVDYTLYDFKTLKLNLNQNRIIETMTQNGLICDFDIKYSMVESKSTHYYYFLVIRNGIRSFSGVADGWIQSCGVIACPEPDIKTCGKRSPDYSKLEWPLTFEKISLRLTTPRSSYEMMHFPSTLNSSFMPISDYDWNGQGTKEYIMTLKSPQKELLTFGIYGRKFTNSGLKSSSTPLLPSMIIGFIVCLISRYLMS